MLKATFKCLSCGLEKPVSEIAEKVSTPSLGGEKCRYVCTDCANVHQYESDERMMMKDDCKGRKASLHVLTGIEWEAVFKSKADAAALTAKPYYGTLTKDSSLPIDALECKFRPMPLASTSKSIEGWVKFSDPTHQKCGQHINVSVEEWVRSDLWDINNYKDVLFSHLFSCVIRDGDNNFFGRALNHYAQYPFNYNHYDAVRIKFNSGCIEFRLCKYRDGFTPRRFYLIVSMIVEIIEKINTWYIQKLYEGKDAKKAAEKAAEKIAEVYESYQNGTARAIKRGVIDWQ